MSQLEHHIAHSLHDLANWRDQWNALADAQGLPLARYDWFLAAEKHLASKDSVRVVYAVDAAGDLSAAAALESRANDGGHINYQLLGMPRLYEPSTILYRDEMSRRALLRALTSLDRPIILARLWQDPSIGNPDESRCRLSRDALWLTRNPAPSQYLDLSHDYAGYLSQLPSQRRYDLRRAYRRAEATGPLTMRFVRPTSADLDEVLGLALGVESRSWKGDSGSSVLANGDLHRFFSDMLRSYAAEGNVFIALLNIGTTPAAIQICLLHHQRLWMLKIGYDQAFHRLSPGLILMNEVIKHSYDLGLRGIEFLGSAEDWVDAWKPSLRHYRLLAAYPCTAKSLMRFGRDVAKVVVRNLRHAKPAHE